MRTILLAGCLLCLAVFASPTLAAAASDEAAIAPDPAIAVAAEAAPVPAEAAPALAGATACSATEPQALGDGGFNNWCGDPCTPPSSPWGGGDNSCVAYDCRGILAIGFCTCVDNRWACDWDCQFD